jgi:hypothetical protein
MGKANPDVSVPGAPGNPTASQETATDTSGAPAADARDAEIAALRAQLAASQAAVDPSKALVMEADGPNVRRYRAESKHLDYTAAELHKLVLAGEVKLTDHHVLCSDGWLVNPQAQKQANG